MLIGFPETAQACVLMFDDPAQPTGLGRGEDGVPCAGVTGFPVVSRNGWLAATDAVMRMMSGAKWPMVSSARATHPRDVVDVNQQMEITVRPVSDLDERGQ